ncbi:MULTISPECIES: DNA-packaging protein [Pacificibacter]|uniref:DNA-packaging protein n=1 Tax=Pacificibacter TaxID=1042323 RepID=UPI001C083FE5|nr:MULTISPECIES: terminase family protein [Pacificibacter]MBU2935643.1 terminase family protein [Pacificibacter marinus]MDO6614139.1 terminase family protein [Pacificibacter sp. 1_MG-2023]
MEPSTLTPPGLRSLIAWIASEDLAVQTQFLNDLESNDQGALLALPFLFEAWALDHQLPPAGDWRTWVIMGGRGAGKTRASSEWVRSMVEGARALEVGRAKRVALVGETYDQAREVMVFGDSGILACSPPDRRPKWIATRRALVWPNGAEAMVFSGNDPEALRGPQFDAAWVDELAKWKKPREAWDMLQFGLRLGDDPRQVVTTTPRNVSILKEILDLDSSIVTRAPTEANAANLAPSFLEEVRRRYAGTRLGRQELDGVLLDEEDGALWSLAKLEEERADSLPDFDRIVVAVDPPVTSHKGSDECGIIVVGAVTQGPPQDWRAYVLEDATMSAASPTAWAKGAIDALERWEADKIVAEVNQGGDLVESVLRQVDPMVPYKSVRATRGKAARAEPVAALYDQGRVFHTRGLGDLEDQMVKMTSQGFQASGSPDRLDALVWAIYEVMIAPAAGHTRPRIRTLG